MTPGELYDRALARQQRRQFAVIRRWANVIQLRDPWAIYDADGRLLFRIPMKSDTPRMHEIVGFFVDALMLLNHEAPAVATEILRAGVRTGWARWDGRAFAISVPLACCSDTEPEPRAVVGRVGEAFTATRSEFVEAFRLVGGARRLAATAKADPEWFAKACGDVFIRPKEKAEGVAAPPAPRRDPETL